MAEHGASDPRPESDIYSVLIIVASVFLATGTIFVSIRADALFGNWMPFTF
jgi:hypothetical protein